LAFFFNKSEAILEHFSNENGLKMEHFSNEDDLEESCGSAPQRWPFVLLLFNFLFFDKDFALRFSVVRSVFRPPEQAGHGLQASARHPLLPRSA